MSQTEELTKTKTETKKPKQYQVLLLNDDFTPMDFVTYILKTIFKKNTIEAEAVMLEVHHKGRGLAGIYSKEIAETKTAQTLSLAEAQDYPLQCVFEPVD